MLSEVICHVNVLNVILIRFKSVQWNIVLMFVWVTIFVILLDQYIMVRLCFIRYTVNVKVAIHGPLFRHSIKNHVGRLIYAGVVITTVAVLYIMFMQIFCDSASPTCSVGRASDSHAGSRGLESRIGYFLFSSTYFTTCISVLATQFTV